MYHNKGMDNVMINLPHILRSKPVILTIPNFIACKEPLIVSYSYSRKIGRTILNHKQCIDGLDFDKGTSIISCNCRNT